MRFPGVGSLSEGEFNGRQRESIADMSDTIRDDEAAARERTQWLVGIAALRKIGELVRGFRAEEEFNRRASRVVVLLFGAAALGVLALFLVSPNALLTLFRALS